MGHVLASTPIVLCLVLIVGLARRHFSTNERHWLWACLLLHIATAISHVYIVRNLYGTGDMDTYHRLGVMFAAMLRDSPVEVSWLLVQELFQHRTPLFPPELVGGATGSMFAISTFVAFLANDSLVAASILVGGFAFLGKLATYRTFRSELAPEHRPAALFGCLFIPSVAFWSSGLLKETIAVGGLGLAVFGGYALATRHRSWLGLSLFIGGTTAVALVKAYLLMPFGIAAGLWLFFDGHRAPPRRRQRSLRVGGAVVGVAVVLSAFVGIGHLFPRFDVTSLASELAHQQRLVEQTRGGSDYAFDEAGDGTLRGHASQVPFALATALFRPTLLEASNPQIVLNAAETFVTTLLLLWVLLAVGPHRCLRRLREQPLLVFSLAMALGIALGVGMATTNLGSLSRYRAPMMPFYVVPLLVLARGVNRRSGARAHELSWRS